MTAYTYFNRDISWLYFNDRVLKEAAGEDVPLIERIKFLGIYSSNLDEFYRVRMPVLMALNEIKIAGTQQPDYYQQASQLIQEQLNFFGHTLYGQIIPALKENNIHLIYKDAVPGIIKPAANSYFFNVLAAYIEVIYLKENDSFFPENNKLYIAVALQNGNVHDMAVVSIPSGNVSRFFTTESEGKNYILFIDDIIKDNLEFIFPGFTIKGAYSIKVTRDAALDLQDEFEGDIAEKIEMQISRRDLGLATRFLYQPDMPESMLAQLAAHFNLGKAGIVAGGNYHNLKDFSSFPLNIAALLYAKQPAAAIEISKLSLHQVILEKDILVHPPYQSYETILRFFNEAALDEKTEEIYTTMYRVANDSRIVHALISAAKNGKKVTAFVELKARFDEANNIKWAKVMKAAGVKIIYSIPQLKVHAKIALVKKKNNGRMAYLGLLATGNLNESTARFYTDHILLTANGNILRELELLFIFLTQRKKTDHVDKIKFQHLLVAQFNLQKKFLSLIDNEISNAQKGLSAGITIKLNNLEEEVLINKLYEASNAGVKVNLIVRSICRIIPGVKNMSDNITVRRIVDRYLEHGRIFIFENNGEALYFLGSADWMNRNIYRRVEVCFPLYDKNLQQEIKEIINLQLSDNTAAVLVDEHLKHTLPEKKGTSIRSQLEIYKLLQKMKINFFLFVVIIYCISCNNSDKQYKSPQGYNLAQPEKFAMPAVLNEISGITFSKVSNDTIYAEQDEEGELFHFKSGDRNIINTKFGKKGDYEDLAICNNTVIILKSDGTLFSFSLNAAISKEADSVQEWKDLIPKGEYEGMYADDSSNIYVLCKNCGGKQTNGYILKSTESNIAVSGNFIIDTKAIEELSGDKKIKFHPSALAKNPLTSEWFILSSVNKLLVIAGNDWAIKNVYPLNAGLFNQPEGIAFDKQANLFISNEGGDTGQGNILKFNYNKQ